MVATAGVVLVAAYAWWAVGLEPFSWHGTMAVVAAGLAAVAVGARRRGVVAVRTPGVSPRPAGARTRAPGVSPRPAASGARAPGASPRPAAPRARAPGGARWGALAVVAAAWQLAAYLQEPREDHPTLSSLTNAALDSQPARAAAFVVWLLATVGLARR